jgi:hypothetical protein
LALKYEFDKEAAKAAWRAIRGTMAGALRGAMTDIAKQVQQQGRAEIARAGFSPRLQRGFRTYVFPRIPKPDSLDMQMRGRHRVGYFNIFERGGVIHGKPLLWIPLPSAPAKINGRPTTAAAYVQNIGPLHSINRPGRPPLLAGYSMRAPGPGRRLSVAQLRTGQRNTRRRQARAAFGGRLGARPVSVPLFVGVSATRIADRMNVSAVYNRARRDLPDLYAARVRRGP